MPLTLIVSTHAGVTLRYEGGRYAKVADHIMLRLIGRNWLSTDGQFADTD
jgi:hypothetical protein